MEGTKALYQSPSHGRHKSILHEALLLEGTYYILQKPFLWKAILFIVSQQLKEHCQGKTHLSA